MSDFLKDMDKLSSAEEIMNFLAVAFDPEIVKVNRLHILKRFHDYLTEAGLPDASLTDDALKVAYAGWLEKAYDDFTRSDGVTEKVFKVFKQQAAMAAAGNQGGFVPLTSLKKS